VKCSLITKNTTILKLLKFDLIFRVHKEQYCCCKKWSPCERRLAALVAILISVIVILVIVVGILATTDQGIESALNWQL